MLQPARADVAELVDARDLKSLDGNVVRVRFPPSAPVECGEPIWKKNVLLKIVRCAALLASILMIPTASLAQSNEWPNALVCQASVQSYFNLPQPPRQIDESWGWLIFKSALGGVYDCKVWGSSVSLKWKSHNGTMSNSRTQADANGPVLTVRPGGMGEWRFRRIADGYGLLNGGKHR